MLGLFVIFFFITLRPTAEQKSWFNYFECHFLVLQKSAELCLLENVGVLSATLYPDAE